MAYITVSDQILSTLNERSKDNFEAAEFLRQVIYLEIQNSAHWQWKSYYKNLIESYIEKGGRVSAN